ncbi:MAG: hypothetical protein LQ338_003696 [Usnochroma carphineum]|nr:MAG: hypothetical protein LQ338_003696 [Usnochroma carphineum]
MFSCSQSSADFFDDMAEVRPIHHISQVRKAIMAEPSIYDEIELEDLTYHPDTTLYTYPCPCGDQFEITLQDLRDGEDIAVCPSCSLMIKVIFEAGDLPAEEPPKEQAAGAVVEVAA